VVELLLKKLSVQAFFETQFTLAQQVQEQMLLQFLQVPI
jgi:hypothetical protein